MLHQAGNVVNVPGQTIELGDDDRDPLPPSQIQRGRERRSMTFIVLAALGLCERLSELKPLGGGKAGQRSLLGLQAQARPSLPSGRDADVRYCPLQKPVGNASAQRRCRTLWAGKSG